ncbi:MAG: Fic family protein [Bacteroidetes bacterium]|nr:Fic family protein [Bacteroidota bacterium]
MSKYKTNKSEAEILPNKLGIKDIKAIQVEELTGFVYAQVHFIHNLKQDTRFDLEYLYSIHGKALSHLYDFAGQTRQVDMSKGGFQFPSVKFLDENLQDFDNQKLKKFSEKFSSPHDFVAECAHIHAELLFMHPFREGNGRTMRLFADLMALHQGFREFNWGIILDNRKEEYITAVQCAGKLQYQPMIDLMTEAFNEKGSIL